MNVVDYSMRVRHKDQKCIAPFCPLYKRKSWRVRYKLHCLVPHGLSFGASHGAGIRCHDGCCLFHELRSILQCYSKNAGALKDGIWRDMSHGTLCVLIFLSFIPFLHCFSWGWPSWNMMKDSKPTQLDSTWHFCLMLLEQSILASSSCSETHS